MDATEVVRKTVRLRPGALSEEEMARYGWTSVRQAAAACGLSTSTLTRCIAGELAPGNAVIAALLDRTRRPFDQLFVIV